MTDWAPAHPHAGILPVRSEVAPAAQVTPGSTLASTVGSVLPIPECDAETLAPFGPLVSRLLVSGSAGGFSLAMTSANGDEGTTTASVSTALALSRSTGENVLLVDANVHHPMLHERFGTSNDCGFCDLIESCSTHAGVTPSVSDASTVAYARRTAQDNLRVLPLGAPKGSPTALLTSHSAHAVVAALSDRFGFVVFDCPPLVSSVEAASLCRLADGVALVVRAGATPREDVLTARARLSGASLLGVVLCGV